LPRAREATLAQLTARLGAADAAADWHAAALRARAKIGAAVRRLLAQSQIDPARVAMLQVSDAASRELATAADRPQPRPAAAPPPDERGHDIAAEAFATRLGRLVQRYRAGLGIDFAQASLAETLAWCLARPQNRRRQPPAARPKKLNPNILLLIRCRSSSKTSRANHWTEFSIRWHYQPVTPA
jgi:hypothetical protein